MFKARPCAYYDPLEICFYLGFNYRPDTDRRCIDSTTPGAIQCGGIEIHFVENITNLSKLMTTSNGTELVDENRNSWTRRCYITLPGPFEPCQFAWINVNNFNFYNSCFQEGLLKCKI